MLQNRSEWQAVIEIKDLTVTLGGRPILQKLNLSVNKGEVLAVVGGSGAGKTTLLRSILMLLPAKGSIKVFGKEISNGDRTAMEWVRSNWGVMFQHGALFSSLTVLENVAYLLKECTELDSYAIEEIARLKIAMVGLESDAAHKYPSELSGGMKKRAAIARAIALDPQLLFLDEPTSGLDPHGASALDELILDLKESLGLTVVMVTHDLDTLWRVTTRVAFLGGGEVLEVAPMKLLTQSRDPTIHEYFSDIRAQVARNIHEVQNDSND